MSRIVIALGGNALGNNPEEQQRMIDDAVPSLIELIKQGHEIIITHGNGPQVGMINLAFDMASRQTKNIAKMPLPECAAMSQGYIGYHLQKGIAKELTRVGMPWHVATIITQTEVDEHDPAFSNPTKPIRAFYDEATVKQLMKKNADVVYAEDSGRGWRRMVASPKPVKIVERDSILKLIDHEFIVIACGGGGIPVIKDANGAYHGVPAVIDKDYASAKLADAVGAQYLFMLTAVDKVAINFGKPNQQNLDRLTVEQAEMYCKEGQFAIGSMLPKVQAAIKFAKSGKDCKAVIASLENAPLVMQGLCGTVIQS